MDLGEVWCEDKPSLASEHAVPSSIAGLHITIIHVAETNMASWTLGRPGQLRQQPCASLIRQAACGNEHFRENTVYTK